MNLKKILKNMRIIFSECALVFKESIQMYFLNNLKTKRITHHYPMWTTKAAIFDRKQLEAFKATSKAGSEKEDVRHHFQCVLNLSIDTMQIS